MAVAVSPDKAKPRTAAAKRHYLLPELDDRGVAYHEESAKARAALPPQIAAVRRARLLPHQIVYQSGLGLVIPKVPINVSVR